MSRKSMHNFIEENKIFLIILSIAFVARLFLFFEYHEIWWDSGVYIGMGKHLMSFGSAGLWEHLRPVLWPLILGIGWKSGIDAVLFGRAATFLFSIASIFVFYLVASKIFSKKTAIIASAMFSFSTIFLFLGFRIYTEIPAMFFALLGVYLFLESRYYLSGLSFSLAFLAKFPAALFFIAAALLLAYKKEIKGIAWLGAGFATPVLPFLALNQFFYGNFMAPMVEGSAVIKQVLGCNVLRYKPFYHYFYLMFIDNPLNIFALLGLFLFFKRPDGKKALAFLCLILPLAYFLQLHCRDYRYLTLFIPFVIMFSAFGISSIIRKRKYFLPAVLLILTFSIALSLNYHEQNEQLKISAAEGYYRFMEGVETDREAWTSNPLHAAYTDEKLNKIYYPIFDEGASTVFYEYLVLHPKRVGYVLLDNCGGGLICPPEHLLCKKYLNWTFDYLDDNFELQLNKSHGRCWYKVYKNENK